MSGVSLSGGTYKSVSRRSANFMHSQMGHSPQWHGLYEQVPTEATKTFTVHQSVKIPDMATLRTSEYRNERFESLQYRPAHKPTSPKFNKETMSKSLAPLTQEDKD